MRLEQALFGYDRGHRLIASSASLPRGSIWLLRNVTDMKMGRGATSYLTVVPLPDAGVTAFVRTWSAGPGFRPGSVWSHTLMMSTQDVARHHAFTFLLEAFRRPQAESPDDMKRLKADYSGPIEIDAPTSPEPIPSSVATRTVSEMLAALYSGIEAPEVVARDTRGIDDVILGLLGQQWPELRADFAARTRHRHSPTSVAHFDLEVVERASTQAKPPVDSEGEWVHVLVEDLRRPAAAFREFLREYGPDAEGGAASAAPLVEVFSEIRAPQPPGSRSLLAEHFPRREQMSRLKQDLFGPVVPALLGGAGWLTASSDRLRTLLALPGGVVDYRSVRVGSQLEAWSVESPNDAATAILTADLDHLSRRDHAELAQAIVAGFDHQLAGRLVATIPQLAASVLPKRPDLWSSAEVWTSQLDHGDLLDLIAAAPENRRSATFVGLLREGLTSSASELLASEPSLWWAVLDPAIAREIVSDGTALSVARRLRMGPQGSQGEPSPWTVETLDQARVVALVSDPDDGLWREVPATMWKDLLHDEAHLSARDHEAQVRIQVMALASARTAPSSDLRGWIWSLVFAPLHAGLAGTGTPFGCERTLTAALPHGPTWDWCGRLRRGLAEIAVADGWSDRDLAAVASGAGSFESEVWRVAEELRRGPHKSVLDRAIDLFTGWM